jgi:hypothetical protein
MRCLRFEQRTAVARTFMETTMPDLAALIRARSTTLRRPVAAAMLLLAGCAATSGERPPTQAELLCPQWGYASDDPVCTNTFRPTGRQ